MQRNNDIHHSTILIVMDPNLFQALFPPNDEPFPDFIDPTRRKTVPHRCL